MTTMNYASEHELNDSKRTEQSFEFARDVVKQQISLATGVIALTVTFKSDLLGSTGTSLSALAMWIAMVISIMCGFWTLLALTGSLSSREDRSIWGSNITIPATLQVLAFMSGLVLSIISVAL